MATWNKSYRLNGGQLNNGFFWNGALFRLIINVVETIKLSDNFSEILANIAVRGEKFKLIEALTNLALFKQTDEFFLYDEDAKVSWLFKVADKFNLSDGLTEFLVTAKITDNLEILEKVDLLSKFISEDEEFSLIDDVSFEVFMEALEKFNLKEEFSDFSTLVRAYDTFKMIDDEPRTSEADFILGVSDDVDNAYDWFLPFGLKIDWNTTSIQVMPEAELTKIEIPGIDGSIVEDTVYKDRLFQIVGYSQDGLTRQQKEELKSKIAQILDSTKNESKRMYVQAKDHAFDVKYEGQAVITDGPSYVKATIPLRTPPYGYTVYPTDLIGSGLILNDGDAPLGVQNKISGPVSNPTFRMDQTIYTYSGTVPSGKTLVIDHDLMTCYLEDSMGRKENMLANLTGEFQRIPKHSAITLTVDGETASHITTTWKNKVLW